MRAIRNVISLNLYSVILQQLWPCTVVVSTFVLSWYLHLFILPDKAAIYGSYTITNNDTNDLIPV